MVKAMKIHLGIVDLRLNCPHLRRNISMLFAYQQKEQAMADECPPPGAIPIDPQCLRSRQPRAAVCERDECSSSLNKIVERLPGDRSIHMASVGRCFNIYSNFGLSRCIAYSSAMTMAFHLLGCRLPLEDVHLGQVVVHYASGQISE